MFDDSELRSRETSGFPLSISTGLALETFFTPIQAVYDDPNRTVAPKSDISKYNQFWVNVATLYRNLIASSKPLTVIGSSIMSIAELLIQEMEVIESLLKTEGMGVCSPHFYFVDYKKVFNSVHPSIKQRAVGSPNLKQLDYIFESVKEYILKNKPECKLHDPKLIPKANTKAVFLTHYPYDLLSYKYFSNLDLLESNTGKIKSRPLWNSKYYPVSKADLSNLPFMRTLLMILGDRSLIQPNIFKLRDLIVTAAHTRRWTPVTTREKVISDLEIEIKEPFVLAVIRSIR